MTREEARNKKDVYAEESADIDAGTNIFIDRLIDSIYDDFESRVCGECRYYIDEKGTNLQFCNARTEGGIIGWNGYGKDFGCNKFIRKEE